MLHIQLFVYIMRQRYRNEGYPSHKCREFILLVTTFNVIITNKYHALIYLFILFNIYRILLILIFLILRIKYEYILLCIQELFLKL